MDGIVATGSASADSPPKILAGCLNHSPLHFLHSPPDSNKLPKSDASDSELSELDDEPALDGAPDAAKVSAEPPPALEQDQDDIGEVLPHHWSGTVPVFKPTMDQFKDFKRFMNKVDSYGMTSGIIKIIPPQQWKDSQPNLDQLVKQIRVREPIKQDIMGSNGTYRQVNILHGRSYNLPQWRQLCDQSEHQPPARRGERRANADKPKPPRPKPAAPKQPNTSTKARRRGPGRPARSKNKPHQATAAHDDHDDDNDRPITPRSPKLAIKEPQQVKSEIVESVESNASQSAATHDVQYTKTPPPRRMGGLKSAKEKTQTVSARRKNGRREGSVAIDEEAFKEFDYQMDISDYTAERCQELERAYWKTLTYAPPLYGADMMGTLFDDKTDMWNLNKLPNLLDVLGTKIPGVNTAYLYLGMWKATFAWHLEDVDLYSINYLHFGAPKQWYSISQADAPKFEKAMKNIWPADAKSCSQFLRHKGYLISPQHLLSHYGIRVNKCLSYPGEFVVTYPYGYHSGYNLGYNCAEAVNFALDSWLPMGKIAKRCECSQAQDSVWIDVYEIERKLRGEPTPDYYEETEDDEDDDDDDDDQEEDMSGLPSPPSSHGVKIKNTRKRRHTGEKGTKLKVKKVRLRLRTMAESPCCLCPNDFVGMDLLPTNDGRKVHKMCALFIPETFLDNVQGQEVVCGINNISQARRDLKCLYCRSKKGACFQCSQKRCARAYHATCAAAAGVFVEEQDVPVFGDDGVEYKEQAFEFSCRFHRTRRDKKLDGVALEGDKRIYSAAASAKKGEICQFQYMHGDIFAGMIVENRNDEETFLLCVMPNSERIEVEWKWLLVADPNDYHLPKASANAVPLPTSQKARNKLNAQRAQDDRPRKDDEFAQGYVWAEFNLHEEVSNKEQVKVDFSKQDQIWHYLGKTSTEAKAQYTEDASNQRYNPKGNFLDTIPKPPRPMAAPKAHQYRRYQQYRAPNGQVYYQYTGGHVQQPTMGSNTTGQHHAWQKKHVTPQAGGMLAQQMLPQRQSVLAPATHTAIQMRWRNPASGLLLPQFRAHPSVYTTCRYFQVNYNRPPSCYRTPYSPHGGFVQGYQGNLRVSLSYLMSVGGQTADAMRRWRLQPLAANANAGDNNSRASLAQAAAATAVAAASKQPKATPRHKAYKIPAKESPVPLPPGFLASISSSAAKGKPAEQQQSQPVAGTGSQPATGAGSPSPATPAGSTGSLMSQREQSAKKVQSVKISTTPVPLPPFAVTAQQQQRAPALQQDVQMKQSNATDFISGSDCGSVSVSVSVSGSVLAPAFVPATTAPITTGSVDVAPPVAPQTVRLPSQQEFVDVPGRESMELVEKMMVNLRRASQQRAMKDGSSE